MTALSWARAKLATLPRRAPPQPDPPGVTVPASLVRSANLAAWMAYFCLVYFLLLYTFDIARDRSGTMHFTHVGFWTGDVRVYAPYLFGFFLVAIGIPYVAKIAIPTFMSLDWRANFWPKLWALFIALAVSLVVIAGTFTVQGDTLLERDRESAVAVDTVAQEAAVLAARIADTQHRLDEMTRSESAYIRTAASMSPAAYDAFVAERRDDWQYERLRSYRAQSVEAEALRNQIGELRAQQARQTVTSAVAGRVTTESTSWIAATLGWLEGARAILLSLVMDVVCLIMPWIALRLEQARNRQLADAGRAPAPEAVMIEDHSDEPSVVARPMEAAKEVVKDGETGEVLEHIKPKPYWRKKKGKPQQVQIGGEALPDERGVQYENDARVAMAAAGVVMAPSAADTIEEIADAHQPPSEVGPADEGPHDEGESVDVAHEAEPTTPSVSDEDLFPEIAAKFAAPDPVVTLPNNEGVMLDDEVYGPPAPVRERETEDA